MEKIENIQFIINGEVINNIISFKGDAGMFNIAYMDSNSNIRTLECPVRQVYFKGEDKESKKVEISFGDTKRMIDND